ncbi:putative uncharacterized protein DDB_G0282499 isoform X2 [Aphidius gifuensis]|nr:putative uncharacterized protein DDB_G0282499 isoform X2 [Aphidius gifuensis]
MGMTKMFKWLKKDVMKNDHHQNDRIYPVKTNILNNEEYHNVMRAFISRRENTNDNQHQLTSSSSDKVNINKTKKFDIIFNNKNNINNNNHDNNKKLILDYPHMDPHDIHELNSVPGTKNHKIKYHHAEWKNTDVSIRKYNHPDYKNAIKADLKVLSNIQHPNILLLMGVTTKPDNHDIIIPIFESINCTLYNYINNKEFKKKITIQEIIKYGKNLSSGLMYAHERGYIHSAVSPHSIFIASNGLIKLGGWELAINMNESKIRNNYDDNLRSEILKWLAPEIYNKNSQEISTSTDVYGLTLVILEMCTLSKCIPWSVASGVMKYDQKVDVEMEYTKWKCGIITDMNNNYPPLLTSIVEAGLQLDSTKRTINMPKMNKFLQRLDIQYQQKSLIYIYNLIHHHQQQNNINNNYHSMSDFSTIFSSDLTNEYSQIDSTTTTSSTLSSSFKKSLDSCSINNNTDNDTSMNMFDDVIEMTPPLINENNNKKINILNTVDDSSDPREHIKIIKQTLANKRKNFFNDGNISHISSANNNNNNNENIKLHQVNKYKDDCHTKILKLKNNISLLPIKETLVSDNNEAQAFFEASLWRKERLICMSKMREIKPKGLMSDTNSSNDTNQITNISSTPSNDTYNIKTQSSYIKNNNKQMINVTNKTSFEKLKDALDRATLLVNENTLNSSKNDSNNKTNDYSNEKTIFDELYELNNTEDILNNHENDSGDTYTITNDVNQLITKINCSGAKCTKYNANKNNNNKNIDTCNHDDLNKTMRDEKSGKDYAYFVFDDKPRMCTKCTTCCNNKNTLQTRRMSLPDTFESSTTKINNYSILSEQTIELQNNTVEDIYIDDEFGENLAVNMVLIDEDHSIDDDLFQDFTFDDSS